MSPPGRPKGEFRSAQHEGSPVSPLGRPKGMGFKDLPLNTTEWYCKGVGLVKVQRAEPANSTFLAGGTMTLELTDWQ